MAHDILVIAGLDPSGGAGLIADVRVAELCGVRPIGAATALTVQDTAGVRGVSPVPVDVLRDQLAAILADVEVAAVKIGMLATEAHAEAVAAALDLTAAPVVWDPVLRPTAGSVALYAGDPARAVELLARHVTVATPNLDEAAALCGAPVTDVAGMRAAAEALRARGLPAVLVKGGHLGGAEAVDILAGDGGAVELRGERVALTEPVHGTGCALSTAIACALADGAPLEEACRRGAGFVRARLAAPARPGRGRPAVL